MTNMKKIFLITVISFVVSFLVTIVLLFTPILGKVELLGERTVNPNWNPSAVQSYATEGNLAASTTFFSVANPWGATSTVDYLVVNITGVATSSFLLNCGTSTSLYGETVAPSDTLIDDIRIPTSTTRYIVNGTNSLAGFDAGTNSKDRIVLQANERIMCNATTYVPATDDNAFTNASSTFKGIYKLRFIK